MRSSIFYSGIRSHNFRPYWLINTIIKGSEIQTKHLQIFSVIVKKMKFLKYVTHQIFFRLKKILKNKFPDSQKRRKNGMKNLTIKKKHGWKEKG